MEDDPQLEFYFERLRRAQAILEAERSPEVAAWLSSHAATEAAAAALPAMPDGLLTEPLGGEAAWAWALQALAHARAHLSQFLLLPGCPSSCLLAQLPPLVAVQCQQGELRWSQSAVLRSILRNGLGSAAADLELLTRLLLLVNGAMQLHSGQDPQLALNILQVLEPALFSAAAEARLAQQLARLQQRLDGSAWAGGTLPTVQLLQFVRHNFSMGLVAWVGSENELPAARIIQMAQRSAQPMLSLQPSNPRSSLSLGELALSCRCADQNGVGIQLACLILWPDSSQLPPKFAVHYSTLPSCS